MSQGNMHKEAPYVLVPMMAMPDHGPVLHP